MKKYFFLFFLILLLAPTLVLAQTQGVNCSDAPSTTLCNPIRYPVSDLGSYAFQIVGGFTSFFTLGALIMVVFSGLRMIISRGDSEEISSAKSALTWSIAGLVLAMFAFVIIYATGAFIGAENINPNSYSGTHNVGNNHVIQNPLKDPNFLALITRLLEGFLGIVGILAILMIVVGGFQYVTSRGDEEQVAKGKQTLQWAIMGLVTTLLAYVLVRATATFFGG